MKKNNSVTFLSRFLNHLSDHNSPRGPVYFGIVLVILFTVAASLAPTLSKKLGSLNLRKESQEARAGLEERSKLVTLINNYRSSQNPPLPVLVEDQNLTNAACWKARDMVDNNYFAHEDRDGRTTFKRLEAFGLPTEVGGAENLALGTKTAQETFDIWKNSPGHNSNMLINFASFPVTRIGLGTAYNSNNNWKLTWVMDVTTSYQGMASLTSLSSDCSHQFQNNDPQGNLDAPSGTINCDTTNITGWASDPDTPTQTVEVHMYFDGPAGQGVGFPGIYANLTDHRYSWPIPSQFRTSTHSVYAYAINTQPGNNPLLGGSPKTYTCQLPLPTPPKLDPTAGDVDCNGKIDAVDSLYILRKVANMSINSAICNGNGFTEQKADIVDDDKIDAVDALFVLRIVAGLVTLNPPAFTSSYIDSDGDYMTDSEENQYSCLSKARKDSTANYDSDAITVNGKYLTLNNISEIVFRSSPCVRDTDGDGFGDVAEIYLGTKPDLRCGVDAWPADFNNDKKVDISDITSFMAPIRRLDTSPGDANYNRRWDLVPGKGIFAKDINLQDLTLLTTFAPPMFNGVGAFNGPTCTP